MQAAALAFLALFASHPAEPVPSDWIEIKAGQAFTIKAPPGTKFRRKQGIDSFVGTFVSPNFEIHFDYGIYSNSLEGYRSEKGVTFIDTEIDGRRGVIVTASRNVPSCRTDVSAHAKSARLKRLSFFGPAYPVELTLYGCANTQDDVQSMKSMYRSIRFR